MSISKQDMDKLINDGILEKLYNIVYGKVSDIDCNNYSIARQLVESGKHLDILDKALSDTSDIDQKLVKQPREFKQSWNTWGEDSDETKCICNKYYSGVDWLYITSYFNYKTLDTLIRYAISSGWSLQKQYDYITNTVMFMENPNVVLKSVLKAIEKKANTKVYDYFADIIYVPDDKLLCKQLNWMKANSEKTDLFGLPLMQDIIHTKQFNGIVKYQAASYSIYGERLFVIANVFTNKVVFDEDDEISEKSLKEFIKICLKNKKSPKELWELTSETRAELDKNKAENKQNEAIKKEPEKEDKWVAPIKSPQEMMTALESNASTTILIQNTLHIKLEYNEQLIQVGLDCLNEINDWALDTLAEYCKRHKNKILVFNDFKIDLEKLGKKIDGNDVNTIKLNHCILYKYNKLRGTKLDYDQIEESSVIRKYDN